MTVKFPYLYEHQQDVFAAIKEDNGRGRVYVLKAPRQKGKSILAIVAVLYYAFQNGDSIGVFIEPTLGQCRRVYKQMVRALGGESGGLIKSSNGTLLEIELVNGAQIVLKSAEQREALRGLTVKNSILILDECAFIEDDIIQTLLPIVDAHRCPILAISTPLFESGFFYEKYVEGLEDRDFVKSFDWGCDSKYDFSALLSPEKLEYYRQTLPPLKFRSEYLGLFLTDKSFVFGDFSLRFGVSNKPPVFAGLDFATGSNEKDDYTCIVFMDEDRKVVDIRFWKVVDPLDMIDQIAAIVNSMPTLKVLHFEKNSIGAVYYSALKRTVKNKAILREFITSNESKRRIIEQLIEAFARGLITIPNDERLTRQLQGYAIEKLKNGGYTYNAMSGFNDDAVMALAMCYDVAMRPAGRFHIGFA